MRTLTRTATERTITRPCGTCRAPCAAPLASVFADESAECPKCREDRRSWSLADLSETFGRLLRGEGEFADLDEESRTEQLSLLVGGRLAYACRKSYLIQLAGVRAAARADEEDPERWSGMD